MSKKTAMQELKSTVQNIIDEMNGQLSDYDSGYKRCLIGLMNDINYTLMKMEREQIVKVWNDGNYNYFYNRVGRKEFEDGNEYYNETYGGNNE
jgi:hypothetical protein